jgi:glycosyltransferase involved in cell wall biosynthesis
MTDAHKKSPLVSIIIPLYNEEKSIRKVLQSIPNHFSYEVIVVNDGSTDNSAKKVKKIEKENIILFDHQRNKGYGAAILTGFEKASGDIIVTLDSDGQHDPQEIPRLIEPILSNNADIVIGSRYLGRCHYSIPFYTRFGEYLINMFLQLFFHQKVKNNQSGFRSFSKQNLLLFVDMDFRNFGFCTELLFKAAANELMIKEVPINVKPREYGNSYVKLFKILITISACIVKYGLKKFELNHLIPKFMRRLFLKVSKS